MLTNLLRNRQYELIVGDYKANNGILITDLQVTFDISKTSDNKKNSNSAAIEIYNLNEEHRHLLDTDYPAAVFSAGYVDTGGPKRLFSGQVTQVTTRKSGADLVTQIQMGSGYTDLNQQVLSQLTAPGRTVKDVLEDIRKNLPGVSRGVYNGTNLNSPILYGYPLSGTPKDMLDELSGKYNLDWQIEEDVLYAHDRDRANTENFQLAYVISPHTGLLDLPYRTTIERGRAKKDKVKKPGVQFKMLLNPDIKAGDIIKLEDTIINGWYKVDSLRHSGSFRGITPWYTELRCTTLEKVTKS